MAAISQGEFGVAECKWSAFILSPEATGHGRAITSPRVKLRRRMGDSSYAGEGHGNRRDKIDMTGEGFVSRSIICRMELKGCLPIISTMTLVISVLVVRQYPTNTNLS